MWWKEIGATIFFRREKKEMAKAIAGAGLYVCMWLTAHSSKEKKKKPLTALNKQNLTPYPARYLPSNTASLRSTSAISARIMSLNSSAPSRYT